MREEDEYVVATVAGEPGGVKMLGANSGSGPVDGIDKGPYVEDRRTPQQLGDRRYQKRRLRADGRRDSRFLDTIAPGVTKDPTCLIRTLERIRIVRASLAE